SRIELRNFGVFEVKQRKPRKARNPRTGARVDVEAKNVVTFQPGKTMEERVRKYAKPIEPKRKTRKGGKPEEESSTPSPNGTTEPRPVQPAAEPVTAGAETPVATG